MNSSGFQNTENVAEVFSSCRDYAQEGGPSYSSQNKSEEKGPFRSSTR